MIINKFPFIQNIEFCMSTDFACYTEVSKENVDCDVSCTGLYADVIFNEDRVLNLKTDLGEKIKLILIQFSFPQ